MKKLIILFFILSFGAGLNAQRNLFAPVWNEATLEKVLAASWHPYPVYSDRNAWDSIPRDAADRLLNEGAKLLGKPFEFLPVSEYLGFVRDGNRNRFERIYFGRRSQLLQLLMAECIEGQGRFRDDILNGIWALCEESSWCIPAHIGQPTGIPDTGVPVVDLFAAETAALLAWTDYIYGSEIEHVSPLIRSRLRKEVQTRVLQPFMDRNDFWWMGLDDQPVNNWNPWILSNILPAALLTEDNRERQIQLVAKSLRCLDKFTNGYPDDGGCDEGPGYWGRAGASLFDCLETLYSASGGKINYYGHPLIGNIGRYIYKAYIHNPWYINFADASAKILPDAYVIYRYGRQIGDMVLSAFGARLDAGSEFTASQRIGSIGRTLPYLFGLHEIRNAPKAWPYLRDAWLPDLQVVAARSMEGRADGLYFAAKGGHNAESHNHNDVGSFIVYFNGQPVLIDAGVGAYTAKTFSQERYTIWSMQSQYHNLPTVNGHMQQPGREFAARDPLYLQNEKSVRFSLSLSDCYPREAAIEKWNRNFEFDRNRKLTVTDRYKLNQIKGTTSWNLLTCLTPRVTADGCITLSENGPYKAERNLEIRFSAKENGVIIEEIKMTPADGFIWETSLYRIVITPVRMNPEGEFRIIVQGSNPG